MPAWASWLARLAAAVAGVARLVPGSAGRGNGPGGACWSGGMGACGRGSGEVRRVLSRGRAGCGVGSSRPGVRVGEFAQEGALVFVVADGPGDGAEAGSGEPGGSPGGDDVDA